MLLAQLQKHANAAFAALWALVGGFACAWMIPLEANMLEEGIALHLSQRMMGGEHLFRDLASFTGPLPFELLALLFRIFGDDLMVARGCLLYTSPSPRDQRGSRMPSSA